MGYSKNQKSSYHTRSLNGNRRTQFALHSKQKLNHSSKHKRRESPSDLWVPKNLASDLERQIFEVGSLKKILHRLLMRNRYRIHTLFANSNREKTMYQESDLELVRFSFRPDSADWAELRVVARYYGVSICRLFVMLLFLEKGENMSVNSFVIGKMKQRFQNIELAMVQKILPGRTVMSFSISLESDYTNFLLTG